MKITKSILKQIIKEELENVLMEAGAGDLMVDPAITNMGYKQLAKLADEERAEEEQERLMPREVRPEDVYRLADQLIKIDKKTMPRMKRGGVGGGDNRGNFSTLTDEYIKTAKSILMGHPRGYSYRTSAIEMYLKSMQQTV